ncbi:MAG: hypothetical protein HC804_11780 [Anaerolineae bacterium]|nr:hypothetical protein [Anaerolineae bacterium]
MNWLEEIFADVYGCLVAGPVMAYDFQELSLDNKDFNEDDGEHPLAAIRPFIYTQVLRTLEQDNAGFYQNAPQLLDANWNSWLIELNASGRILPNGETVPVPLGDAKSHLERLFWR